MKISKNTGKVNKYSKIILSNFKNWLETTTVIKKIPLITPEITK